jgi:hypothetical protein
MKTISLKPLPKIFVTLSGGTTLLLAGLAAAPTAFAAPELSVYINGPEKLQTGLRPRCSSSSLASWTRPTR